MNRAALRAAAVVFVFLSAAHPQTIQVDKSNRTIAVTATDTARAEADVATVSVGFETYAPDADTAYAQGSRISNAILEALHKAGVPDQSIESREQNLTRTQFPFDDHSTPEQKAERQFMLSQSWAVHTPATDAAKVLHAAIEAGANQSGNIDWDVSDRDTLQAKAAAKSLVHARAIAAQMAQGLKASLGPLLYASNQAPEHRVFPLAMMKEEGGPAAARAVRPLAIRPRQVEESATVYAVFSIE